MARFIATVQGQSGPASRIGSAGSGIESHPRGWNVGVRVVGAVDPETGEDVFRIYATRGSNGGDFGTLLGTLTAQNGRGDFVPTFAEAGS